MYYYQSGHNQPPYYSHYPSTPHDHQPHGGDFPSHQASSPYDQQVRGADFPAHNPSAPNHQQPHRRDFQPHHPSTPHDHQQHCDGEFGAHHPHALRPPPIVLRSQYYQPAAPLLHSPQQAVELPLAYHDVPIHERSSNSTTYDETCRASQPHRETHQRHGVLAHPQQPNIGSVSNAPTIWNPPSFYTAPHPFQPANSASISDVPIEWSNQTSSYGQPQRPRPPKICTPPHVSTQWGHDGPSYTVSEPRRPTPWGDFAPNYINPGSPQQRNGSSAPESWTGWEHDPNHAGTVPPEFYRDTSFPEPKRRKSGRRALDDRNLTPAAANKRRKNRDAANRCRQKRKDEEDHQLRLARYFEGYNKRLKVQCKSMIDEYRDLRLEFAKHAQCDPQVANYIRNTNEKSTESEWKRRTMPFLTRDPYGDYEAEYEEFEDSPPLPDAKSEHLIAPDNDQDAAVDTDQMEDMLDSDLPGSSFQFSTSELLSSSLQVPNSGLPSSSFEFLNSGLLSLSVQLPSNDLPNLSLQLPNTYAPAAELPSTDIPASESPNHLYQLLQGSFVNQMAEPMGSMRVSSFANRAVLPLLPLATTSLTIHDNTVPDLDATVSPETNGEQELVTPEAADLRTSLNVAGDYHNNDFAALLSAYDPYATAPNESGLDTFMDEIDGKDENEVFDEGFFERAFPKSQFSSKKQGRDDENA